MRKFVRLSAAVLPALMLGGCNLGGTDISEGAKEIELDYTLNGKLFNAVTGAAITAGTDDSKVVFTLIQGDSTRSESKFDKDAESVTAGEYVINDIPMGTNAASATNYRLMVNVAGYDAFETVLTTNVNSLVSAQAGDSENALFVDHTNFVGDIALFPTGSASNGLVDDVTVTVADPTGAPVVGANVVLSYATPPALQFGSNNTMLTNTRGSFISNITATTVADANGNAVATIPAASLSLGTGYTIVVNPATVTAGNLQMLQIGGAGGTDVTAGTGNQNIYGSMLWSDANVANQGIEVIYASNAVAGSITATGVLTYIFNRPVELDTEANFTVTNSGSLIFEGTVNGTETHTASTDANVTAALDTTGTILTLTPHFEDEPAIRDADADGATGVGGLEASGSPVAGTADDGVTVTFAGGSICAAGTNTCSGIAAQTFASGGTPSATVTLLQQ